MPNIEKKCLRRQKKINFFSDKWINIETVTRKIAKQLKGVTFVKKLVEAKSIIKWCLYTCKKSQRTFYKRFRNLKEKFCNIINKLQFDKNLHNEIEILCGESLHTKATEPFYYEFSYKKFTNPQKK